MVVLVLFLIWGLLSQEASPSVVFIKDLELTKVPKTSPNELMLNEDEDAKVEGTGSGFIWDKFGHIVRKQNQKDNNHFLLYFNFMRLVILLDKLLLARYYCGAFNSRKIEICKLFNRFEIPLVTIKIIGQRITNCKACIHNLLSYLDKELQTLSCHRYCL